MTVVVVVGERDDGGSEMRECVHEASVSVKEKEGEGKERRERERRRPGHIQPSRRRKISRRPPHTRPRDRVKWNGRDRGRFSTGKI